MTSTDTITRSEFVEVVRDDVISYSMTKKFPSGMTAECGYHLSHRYDTDEVQIYPYLTIFKKRKKRWPDDPTEVTGKDGLAPAIWASQCLDLMEWEMRYVFRGYGKTKLRIIVEWVDARRRDVYCKFLERKGFYLTHYENIKCLEKIIDITE